MLAFRMSDARQNRLKEMYLLNGTNEIIIAFIRPEGQKGEDEVAEWYFSGFCFTIIIINISVHVAWRSYSISERQLIFLLLLFIYVFILHSIVLYVLFFLSFLSFVAIDDCYSCVPIHQCIFLSGALIEQMFVSRYDII